MQEKCEQYVFIDYIICEISYSVTYSADQEIVKSLIIIMIMKEMSTFSSFLVLLPTGLRSMKSPILLLSDGPTSLVVAATHSGDNITILPRFVLLQHHNTTNITIQHHNHNTTSQYYQGLSYSNITILPTSQYNITITIQHHNTTKVCLTPTSQYYQHHNTTSQSQYNITILPRFVLLQHHNTTNITIQHHNHNTTSQYYQGLSYSTTFYFVHHFDQVIQTEVIFHQLLPSGSSLRHAWVFAMSYLYEGSR